MNGKSVAGRGPGLRVPAFLAAFVFLASFTGGSTFADRAAAGDDVKSAPPGTAAELRLQVKVVDTAGKPVANATVRVFALSPVDETDPSRVEFADDPRLKTDAEGMLVTPPLPPGGAYFLGFEAPRMLSAVSRWSRPADTGGIRLPAVVLRRLFRMTGTVVDRDGRPIVGATVIQSGDGPERIATTTDAQGRFTIDGVPEGVAFLCVTQPGYRFTGQQVSAGKDPFKFILERIDDRNLPGIRTLAPRRSKLPPADRKALSLQLLKRPFDAMLAHEPLEWDLDLAHALIAVDPDYAFSQLGRIDRSGISKSYREDLLCRLATGLAKTSLGESERLISQLSETEGRFWAYHDVLRVMPKSDRAVRTRLLSEMTRLTGTMDRSETRIYWICDSIVPFLVEHRDLDGAQTLLAEARSLAEALPSVKESYRLVSYARLARAYSLVDSRTSLELLKDASEHHLLMVSAIAAKRDPAMAEDLLNRLDFQDKPGLHISLRYYFFQIGYRVALTDGERAERMMRQFWDRTPPAFEKTDQATELKPPLIEAQLLGFLSEAAARSDKLRARRLLEQAVAILEPLAKGSLFDNDLEVERETFYGSPATVMATLIPVAEKIDPALAREVFWQALALREPPLTGDGHERHRQDVSLAFLALLLDRYDHETANALFAPVLQRELSRSFNGWPIVHWIYDVRSRLDPESTEQFARELLANPANARDPAAAAFFQRHTARMLVAPRETTAEDDRAQREEDRRMIRKTMLVDVRLEDPD